MDSVIIHRGAQTPEYIRHFVHQFYTFNRLKKLWLIIENSDKLAKTLLSDYPCVQTVLLDSIPPQKERKFFMKWNRMNHAFRGGFWRYAIERFFILHDFMSSQGIKTIIHFEYDNMIYFDIEKLSRAFDGTTQGISLPADSNKRCIPSVVFIKDVAVLQRFCATYNTCYLPLKYNDMIAFSKFSKKKKNACSFLPLVPSWYKDGKTYFSSASGKKCKDIDLFDSGYSEFNGVFDAAAIGQYLGGVDPRNDNALGPGFINETAMYSPADMKFEWQKDEEDRLIPYGEYAGQKFRIFNLHIHSKGLEKFRS